MAEILNGCLSPSSRGRWRQLSREEKTNSNVGGILSGDILSSGIFPMAFCPDTYHASLENILMGLSAQNLISCRTPKACKN